jgi:hypothetical protein
VATSSMALVILPVLRTDLIRRAMSCWVATAYAADSAFSPSPSTKKLSLNVSR